MPALERATELFGLAMPDEIDDVCITCPSCGRYHSIYITCNDNASTIGRRALIEDDDISIADAVEVLHREARKIEAIG